MNTTYFEFNSTLLKTAQELSTNLSQCVKCKIIWVAYKKDSEGNDLSPQVLDYLDSCARELSERFLSAEKLASLGIFLSSGFCQPCLRVRIRELINHKQEKMGYHPCFATAVHGHCSQNTCSYYNICVVDQKQLHIWKKRIEEAHKYASL